MPEQDYPDNEPIGERPFFPVGQSQTNPPTPLTIQIMGPEGTLLAYPMEHDIITVGRGEDNSIIIRDPSVALYHVEIRREPGRMVLIDLQSATGTYLGNEQIDPNELTTWIPERAVRVGRYFLRLEGFVPQQETSAATPPPVSVPIYAQPPVALFLNQTAWTVAPGSSQTANVVIVNNSNQGDNFALRVEGISAEWFAIPAPVYIPPGGQNDASIRLSIPPAPQGRAGEFPIQISAVGQGTGAQSERRNGSLNVPALTAFSAELFPISAPMGDEVEITVENRGNQEQTFDLVWHDKESALVFEPSQDSLTLAPGAKQVSRFRADWDRRPWFGSQRMIPITAEVTAGPGEQITKEGQFIGKPRLPWWVLALPFLCLICAALPVFAMGRIGLIDGIGALFNAPIAILDGGIESTPDAADIAATQNAAAYATAEAEVAEAANLVFAATESWLELDDDVDGLTNREEQQYGTLADKRDTDEDGIDDGDEIFKWLTDPTRKDTDGDGLPDGDEVARGIDPRSSDTDQDGTPDPSDSNPGQAPTPTPDARKTAIAIERATAQAGCEVNVGYDLLNLRLGPDEVYEPPLAKLPSGTRLIPMAYRNFGAADGEWIEVVVRGTSYRGWVSLEWVTCNMQVVNLPPGEIPPTPTPTPTVTQTPTATAVPLVTDTVIPNATASETPVATNTSESPVTPPDTGGTLPPPLNGDDLTTLPEIYAALQLTDTLPAANSTFAVGAVVELSFNLVNQTDKRLVMPLTNGAALIGIRQFWIERLGDPEIPNLPVDTPRDGNKYRISIEIIPATILLPGDPVRNTASLNLANYPPGEYELTYQYNSVDGQEVLKSATVRVRVE